MSLPTAVATGAAADSSLAVRPRRAGLVAGVLAAVLVFAVYLVAPVPERIARLFGADTSELARRGGLRMTWAPPAGVDTKRIAKLEAGARKDGDAYVIEVPGVAEADIAGVVDQLAGGDALVFRRVVRAPEMQALFEMFQPAAGEGAGTGADVEVWRPEDGGDTRVDYFLYAPTVQELDKLLARASALGWTLPPGLRLGFECMDARAQVAAYCRTYVVRDVIELGGDDIANAVTSYDPNTNRSIILLDFTRDGAAKLATLTEQIVGEKLATMQGDRVLSAPIINAPIRGGRASITMGGVDAVQQEDEARVLAGVLRGRALPPGGTVRAATFVPPTTWTVAGWISRGVLMLVAGLLIGLLAWAVVRRTRPVRRPLAAVAPGGVPWTRIAVTLLAPLSVLGLGYVPVLGLELANMPSPYRETDVINLGTLGLVPVVTGFCLVELFAVIVPGWRRRRHAGDAARRPFANLVPAVVLVLAALQAWMVAGWFLADDGGGGAQFRAMFGLLDGSVSAAPFIGSLIGGVVVLVAVAEVIRTWGLGNGYGALAASGWIIALVRVHLRGDAIDDGVQMLAVLAPITIVLVGVITARWRIARIGELALRVPTSGTAPVTPGSGAVLVLVLAALMVPGPVSFEVTQWTFRLVGEWTLLLVLVVVTAVGWSAAFARGRRLGRIAARAGAAGPSGATWREATLLSVAVLFALALLQRFVMPAFSNGALALPLSAADGLLTAAVLLDIVHDVRGRRVPRVRVWSLHQPHLADTVERALVDADIPCHLSGAHLRAMLSFFGPFAPIDVYVRPEDATRAHAKLSELLPVE